MQRVVIFEDYGYANLLPLTYWRATFELRCGCDQLIDKIRAAVGPADVSLLVRPELADVVAERWPLPVNQPVEGDALFVNGRLLGASHVQWPAEPCIGMRDPGIVFLRADADMARRLSPGVWLDYQRLLEVIETHQARHPRTKVDLPKYGMIRYPWDLVHANGPEITRQWGATFEAGIEGTVYEGVHLLNESGIHVGAGSQVKPCVVLDAEEGPIIIGDNATISPHCTIVGPCSIGDGTLVQAGATLHGGTTLGPVCKVGGEIEESIIHGHSNKQHDGFLGHAYLGEWINIAADCINSDLKNTYGEITVPINGVETPTGEIFVGLTMGDHSKAGINLSFPTGAVVGFGCNVFVSHYPPKFVPSFTWYTDDGRDI